MEKSKWMVKCSTCGTEFNLLEASECNHLMSTKMCPKGHCICDLLSDTEKWREATEDEKQHGFIFMLKEEYRGVKET